MVRERGASPRRDRRRRAGAGSGDGLSADLSDEPPDSVRSRDENREARAGRPQTHLLHEFGPEAVDTALKIAFAYHRTRGEGQPTRQMGRERAITACASAGFPSVALRQAARPARARCCPSSTICRTRSISRKRRSRKDSLRGARISPTMERLVTLHDASTIAAMIIEPVTGSTNAVKWLRTRRIRYQAAFSS